MDVPNDGGLPAVNSPRNRRILAGGASAMLIQHTINLMLERPLPSLRHLPQLMESLEVLGGDACLLSGAYVSVVVVPNQNLHFRERFVPRLCISLHESEFIP